MTADPRPGSEHRVVVTGIGAITPLGHSAEESWQALLRGESGIRRITRFDTSDLDVKIGGEIEGFDPAAIIPRTDLRRLDPHAWYATHAALEAMAQATASDSTASGSADGQQAHPFDPTRFAVSVGIGSGAVTLMQEATRMLDARGPKRVQPGVVIYGGPDGAAAYLSQRFDARGPSVGVSATCASGAAALGEAMRAIRHGYLDACLVVAADACLTRVNFAANGNIRSLTSAYNDAPEQASRPFDRDRSGFVMSEGAAAIVLESAEHAAQRRAAVIGEVLGYGASSDAYHATAPHPEGAGAVQAMRAALADAGLSADMIDHINAHGTGTVLNDETEAKAIREVFGARAGHIPITATKSLAGHLIGAAGLFETVVSLQTIRDGKIHPTANLEHSVAPDLEIVTAGSTAIGASRDDSARTMPAVRTVLTNSFGFGGHNVSLVLGPGADASLK